MNKKAITTVKFLLIVVGIFLLVGTVLVVLGAIGGFVYFGVLSPEKFLPEKCFFQGSSGLACLDFIATTPGEITMIVTNGAGFNMDNVSLVFTDTGVECKNPSTPVSLGVGEQRTITIACDDSTNDRFSLSESFKSGINVSYINHNTGLSSVTYGDVIIQLP